MPTDDLESAIGYRGRGRPRLPEGERRREKLSIALNAEEMRAVMHASADAPGGPLRLQDWARAVLLRAAAALSESTEPAEGASPP